jgi:hypothetical protein
MKNKTKIDGKRTVHLDPWPLESYRPEFIYDVTKSRTSVVQVSGMRTISFTGTSLDTWLSPNWGSSLAFLGRSIIPYLELQRSM